MNNQAGVFKGKNNNNNSNNKKSFWTSFYFLVQLGELVQLDVACSMKLKQATQTCALGSTASEARFINLERQGHRSGRTARPDGL